MKLGSERAGEWENKRFVTSKNGETVPGVWNVKQRRHAVSNA